MSKGPDNKGFHRGRRDATHLDVLELSVGGEGTATFARQLHIAQASDLDSDWAIAAQAHPMLVLHSVTTPITDYMTMQHNGTAAKLNVVGGTLNLGAVGSIVINDDSEDVDFRVEGNGNANLLVLDAAKDSLAFGGAVVCGAAVALNNLTARTIVTAVGYQTHMPAQTMLVSNQCGTIAVGAAMFLGIQTINQSPASSCDLTITNMSTLHIAGAPVGAACDTVLTSAHGILVEAGGIQIGIAGGTVGELRLAGNTSGVIKLRPTAAAGTTAYVWPSGAGTCGEQLTSNGCCTTATLSWASASWRHLKDIQGLTCRCRAFDNIVNAEVFDYTYKPEIAEQGQHTYGGAVMTGIMADEAPWAMQGKSRGSFSPINSFGQLTAAFQVLAEKVAVLEGA